VRATLTAMEARFAEFNLRLGSLELARMKLAARFDGAQIKLDRLERDVGTMAAELDEVRAEPTEAQARDTAIPASPLTDPRLVYGPRRRRGAPRRVGS